MAYTFDAVFAVDPANPANVAKNASITIFDPADPAQSPITITDPTGSPLPNPMTLDAAGMGPAFQHPTLARVGWKGAGFVGYFTSYEGMFNETVAAKDAAQAAVGSATAAAADRVTTATVNGSGKLILTKATGATVDAGSVVGPQGPRGADGANVLPTQQAIEQALTSDGPAKAAISSAIVDSITADRGLIAAGGPLNVPTYDGNPNLGHPSVVEVPGGFGGYRYWMAVTPYPFAGRENPSIQASHNGIDWVTPTGLTNPVTPLSEINAAGYTYGSDTHLIHHQGKLWMYYRLAKATPGINGLFLKTSTDGVNWSVATKVVEDHVNGETTLNSPCVEVEADGTFSMWCANGITSPPTMTRRTSPDGIAWSAPTTCTLPTGAYLWHMDVKRVGATYHCLFNSREAKQADQLYYFTSTDGLTWTGDVKIPAVEMEAGSFPVANYYRSAFIPRVGTPLKWDVYTTLTAIIGGVETWRIGLIRDTSLPTVKQRTVATKLAQERTDALFGIDRWIVGDSFNRPDAATLGNATTGQAWTSGSTGIIGRAARANSGSTRSWVETGAANVEVAFDLGAIEETWALLRVTDDSNWLRAGIDNTTGRFHIQKRVAGTITSIYTGSSNIGSGYQARVGDRIRVIAKGNTISLYRNSLLVQTVTEAHNNTATMHGLSLVVASRAKAFAVGAV